MGASEPKLTAHAQMGQDGIAVGERQPQILTSAPRFSKRTTCGLQLEDGRTCQVASYRARMQHLYANDGASGDGGGKATAHHLDLRKFGHSSGGSTRCDWSGAPR